MSLKRCHTIDQIIDPAFHLYLEMAHAAHQFGLQHQFNVFTPPD